MPLHWPYIQNQTPGPRSSAQTTAPHRASKSRPNSFIQETLNRKYPRERGTTTLTILLLLLILLTPQLHAQTPTLDPALAIETLPLYNGPVPNAKGTAPADTPTLTVFRPKQSNGTALIIAPGGGYTNLATSYEGRQEADRFSELGITVFVLKYRLGPTYLYPIPLDDARRAIRIVRSLATKYRYSPDRIGMMGFSAGGHLAATAATLPEDGHPSDPDPVEHESSKLNFLALIYPWLNAMQPQVADPSNGNKLMINYCSVTRGLTQADCTRLDPQYTPLIHVTATTPPTFMVHTADDKTVPVATSVEFFNRMHTAGADCELHLFGHGPHGFGTGSDNVTLIVWQDLLTNWLRAHILLTPPPSAH